MAFSASPRCLQLLRRWVSHGWKWKIVLSITSKTAPKYTRAWNFSIQSLVAPFHSILFFMRLIRGSQLATRRQPMLRRQRWITESLTCFRPKIWVRIPSRMSFWKTILLAMPIFLPATAAAVLLFGLHPLAGNYLIGPTSWSKPVRKQAKCCRCPPLLK